VGKWIARLRTIGVCFLAMLVLIAFAWPYLLRGYEHVFGRSLLLENVCGSRWKADKLRTFAGYNLVQINEARADGNYFAKPATTTTTTTTTTTSTTTTTTCPTILAGANDQMTSNVVYTSSGYTMGEKNSFQGQATCAMNYLYYYIANGYGLPNCKAIIYSKSTSTGTFTSLEVSTGKAVATGWNKFSLGGTNTCSTSTYYTIWIQCDGATQIGQTAADSYGYAAGSYATPAASVSITGGAGSVGRAYVSNQ
jgi:hypothetical protein